MLRHLRIHRCLHGFDGSTLVLSSDTTDVNALQGDWTYDSGTFTWSVTVTAEDGTTQEVYTVTVNELTDTDATLSASVSPERISPDSRLRHMRILAI